MSHFESPITTIRSALQLAQLSLQSHTPDALREARILLCAVLKVKQEYLISYPDKPLTPPEVDVFQTLLNQRAKGTPIAYLLGWQGFYDIEVMVTPDVLIPRPETEGLIEQAIAWAGDRSLNVVDVGAGSGVLALTLAKHLPQAQVTGIDISEAALELARRNASYLKLEGRVRWLHGNLLEPFLDLGEQADLIVANLPYIPTAEMQGLEVSRHEPHLALDGGEDGLAIMRSFLALAPQAISPTGLILMEIGAGQGGAVLTLAQSTFPSRQVTLGHDLAGHERFIRIEAL